MTDTHLITIRQVTTIHKPVIPFKKSEWIGIGINKGEQVIKLTTEFSLN
jgi:hypothetical protein